MLTYGGVCDKILIKISFRKHWGLRVRAVVGRHSLFCFNPEEVFPPVNLSNLGLLFLHLLSEGLGGSVLAH